MTGKRHRLDRLDAAICAVTVLLLLGRALLELVG